MFKNFVCSTLLLIFTCVPSLTNSQESVRLGIPVTQEDLSEFDLIAPPDGSGFPPGTGTARAGKQIYDITALSVTERVERVPRETP